MFGLRPTFAIDLAELEARYLERSRLVHPDRHAAAPAAERVAALQQSMTLNQAYQALRRPISRAEYLLARYGVTIEANTPLDASFLMDVLEEREELAEAKVARDRSRLAVLERKMTARQDQALAAIATAFAAVEAGGADEGALATIKTQLILLRYVSRYLEEFDDEDDE